MVELSAVDAVRKDLLELGEVPGGAGLAAAALQLARELDDLENSATSKSMCAKALLDTMGRLRELRPPGESADGVDEIGRRRERRRAAAAK